MFKNIGKQFKGETDVNGQNSIKSLEAELERVKSRKEEIIKEIAEREEKIKTQGMKKGEIAFNQNKKDKIKKYQRNLINFRFCL